MNFASHSTRRSRTSGSIEPTGHCSRRGPDLVRCQSSPLLGSVLVVYSPPPTWRSRPSLLLLRADTTPSADRVSGRRLNGLRRPDTTTCFRSTAARVVSHHLSGSGYASVGMFCNPAGQGSHRFGFASVGLPTALVADLEGRAPRPRCKQLGREEDGSTPSPVRCTPFEESLVAAAVPIAGVPALPVLAPRFGLDSRRVHPMYLTLRALFRGDDRARSLRCRRGVRALSFHGLLVPLPDQSYGRPLDGSVDRAIRSISRWWTSTLAGGSPWHAHESSSWERAASPDDANVTRDLPCAGSRHPGPPARTRVG